MSEDQIRQEVAQLVRRASDIYLKCYSTGYFKEYSRIMGIARGLNKSLDMPYKTRVKYLKQYNIHPEKDFLPCSNLM